MLLLVQKNPGTASRFPPPLPKVRVVRWSEVRLPAALSTAAWRSSGERAKQIREPLVAWGPSSTRGFPVETSQARKVPSSPHENRRLPSVDRLSQLTEPLCPLNR